MTISKKIKLFPTNKQKTKLKSFTDTARWAYNWTLAKQESNYLSGNKFIQDGDLRKQITQMKKTDEYKWLNNIANDVPKQAVKDACNAYKKFFKGISDKPRFKSKFKSKPSFYNDILKLSFKENKIKLNGFKEGIKCSEQMDLTDLKIANPRISFDGISWWISISYEVNTKENMTTNEPIGIDLGLKTLAVTSKGDEYKVANTKKLEKRLKQKQKRISKHYEILKQNKKEGGSYTKTKNATKVETTIKKLYKRITNIHNNNLHQITSDIIKQKPSCVVMEDLNVKGMMRNKHLSKAVAKARFYTFKVFMEYKCKLNGIGFKLADRWFPSSQMCSECGQVKTGENKLKLRDRVYRCDCGCEIDRDLNAAINLASLA